MSKAAALQYIREHLSDLSLTNDEQLRVVRRTGQLCSEGSPVGEAMNVAIGELFA